MIRTCLIFLATISIWSSTYGQVSGQNTTKMPKQVKVKDWNLYTMLFFEGYFEQIKDTLIKQIGEQEYEKLKANAGDPNVPGALALFDGITKKNTEEHFAKLAKLKLYKIATFTDLPVPGGLRKSMAVLRCPYNENKTWDSTATWDTVYFVIVEEALDE